MFWLIRVRLVVMFMRLDCLPLFDDSLALEPYSALLLGTLASWTMRERVCSTESVKNDLEWGVGFGCVVLAIVTELLCFLCLNI